MRSSFLSLLVCALLIVPALADDTPKSAIDAHVAMLEEIFEAVLEHHIEPPTRQEMVLAFLRSLHSADSPRKLAELGPKVSDVTDKLALYELMRSEMRSVDPDYKLPERLEDVSLAWLGVAVPGGVQLNSVKSDEVNDQLAANRYVGIGVQLAMLSAGCVFQKVLENGTAANGGIHNGDVLLEIDGQPAPPTINEIVDRLRGPEGTTLRVKVRSGDMPARDIELRRQVVLIDSVKLTRIHPDAPIAEIKVDTIKASSAHELQKVIEKLPDSITQIDITVESAANFHYFVLFADALLDKVVLGEMITRDGRHVIRTNPGNVFRGRTVKLYVDYKEEQQRPLEFLTLHRGIEVQGSKYENSSAGNLELLYGPKLVLRPKYVRPLYLKESFPILEGRAVLYVPTRRFQQIPETVADQS